MGKIVKLSCFFLICIYLSGCNPSYYGTNPYPTTPQLTIYTARYDIVLTEVQRPAKAKARYGSQKIDKIVEDGVNKYYFEDNMIRIIWVIEVAQPSFVINNKTENSIRLIWDEAAYVDENGFSKRVMHQGVKYADRNNAQPPSIIVRNGRLADFIIPTENVYYREGYYGSWKTKPLFPDTKENNGNAEDFLKGLKSYLGKTFQILLPLQIEDVTNDYIFTFKINDILINGISANKNPEEIEKLEKSEQGKQSPYGPRLVGIIWSNSPRAIIEIAEYKNTFLVTTGEMIMGVYLVKEIKEKSVIIQKGSDILELR